MLILVIVIVLVIVAYLRAYPQKLLLIHPAAVRCDMVLHEAFRA